MSDFERIEPDEQGNVLELPPTFHEQIDACNKQLRREQVIGQLTTLLVEAEEGRVHSLSGLVETSPGTYAFYWTGCETTSEHGARLILLGLRMMGVAVKSDIQDLRDELNDRDS
jgi:hypothetical protein